VARHSYKPLLRLPAVFGVMLLCLLLGYARLRSYVEAGWGGKESGEGRRGWEGEADGQGVVQDWRRLMRYTSLGLLSVMLCISCSSEILLPSRLRSWEKNSTLAGASSSCSVQPRVNHRLH
jgi:hypothetical protein